MPCSPPERVVAGFFYLRFLMDRKKRNDIIDLISRHIRVLGYECLEVEWDAKERTLRAFIDGPNGIVMDDCLSVNRVLMDSEELDTLVDADYRLEVSSPGVERPLRTREHFEKVLGERIHVKLSEKVEDRRQATGRLTNIDDGEILTLELPSGFWRVPLNLIQSANLVYNWNQP
jgi:ribosome maturation factor RimP